MKQPDTGTTHNTTHLFTTPQAVKQQNDAQLQRMLGLMLRNRTPVTDATDSVAVLHELHVHQLELEIQNRELRAAQMVLEESRERYAELYDYAPVGYVTLDAKGVICDANLAAAALLCIARNELVGKPFSASLLRGQSVAFFNYVKQVLAHAETKALELRVRSFGGKPRDVRLIGIARTASESGARVCRIALFDISEENQRQETLRLHSLIMAKMLDGLILVRAADNIILECNPAFERMFGYGLGELTGQHLATLLAANPEAPENVVTRIAKSVRDAGKWEGEINSVRKDGTKFSTQATLTSFEHSAHGLVWVGVHRDMTQHKLAQQQLRERQEELAHIARANSVGELAATLAHELTQPVMAIEHFNHTALSVVEHDQGTREELLQLLRYTNQQVKRAGDVIRQLRKFVRRGVVEKRPISMARLIEGALVLLRPMLDDHAIEVHVWCEASMPLIDADDVQIEQVLVNLICNSAEALATLDHAPYRIDIACVSRLDTIEVVVRDNGPGLDPASEATLFDVFESKKIDGMGMGLAISRSIILAHGGRLWAEPATLGGAAFHFTLPIDMGRAHAI